MNNGFTYQINVQVVGANQINVMQNSLQGVEGLLGHTNSLLGDMNTKLHGVGSAARESFSLANSGVGSFIAGLGIAHTTMSSLGKTADFEGLEKTIKFAGGVDGAKNLEFVNQTVKDLKLPLEASLEGFKTLSGGLMGTGMTGKQTEDIFRSVAEGATVMGLKADETKGVFLALGQMASKGTVSAEELRGQLGERLPGAMGIAARSMGVTQAEFGKMMQAGDVVSSKFLPRFAIEMHKTFSAAVPEALTNARVNFNEFQNSLLQLQVMFGKRIMPAVNEFMNTYLKPAIKFVGEHMDGILKLATYLGGAFTALKLASTGMAIYNTYTAISKFLTGDLVAEVGLLNAVMKANPVLLIATGLFALGAAFIYAWNKVEWFRAGMYGVGYAFKEFGIIVYQWLIQPIYAFGEILIGVLTHNVSLVKSGMNDMLDSAKAMSEGFMGAGLRIGQAFSKGYKDGTSSFVNSTLQPNAVQSALGKGGKAEKATADVGKQKAEGISGGGRSIRNITINVQKVGVDALTIATTTLTEGSARMRDIIMRDLLQVINSANQVQ